MHSFSAQPRRRRLFACLAGLTFIAAPLSALAASTSFLSGVVTINGRPAAGVPITATGNNAVEHAYLAKEGTIKLRLEHLDGVLQITVEDVGTWRPARQEQDRGRGTSIMAGLMDSAEVSHDERGTRVALKRRLTRA